MKKIFSYLRTSLRWFWGALSFTRQLILNLLFVGFTIAVFVILTEEFAAPKTTTEQVQQPQALLINLAGPIVEKKQPIAPFDFASRNLFAQRDTQENLLFEVVDQIRAAAKDPQINGIILYLADMPETSLTKLRYIAKALTEFKQAGKKIVATAGYYTQSQYYLASYADHIFMSEDGAVLLQGYGSYTLYYKDFLEKLNITPHVFRVGEYKSAIEPYTRSNMSEQAKQATAVWLDQLWAAYLSDVANNRTSSPNSIAPSAERMVTLMQEVKGNTALLAQRLGLVDMLATRIEVRAKLAEYFGQEGDDKPSYISIYDYQPPRTETQADDARIAVVVASGVIVDGEERTKQIGGDTLAAQLRDARLNDDIKAVVLRIDSPGGSAFASEVIRNELVALKQAGKPVVASMSSVAASGGYWIAASADKIIAQPTTITGSIGIFGLLTTFDKALAKYGIYNDGLGTTPFAGIGVTRQLPKAVEDIMQLGIEHGYQDFIDLVASARHIALDSMPNIAEGRVWTGVDAMQLNLVDSMGDFDDALAAAAELAKLEQYQIDWMQKPLSPAELLLMELFGTAQAKLMATFNLTAPVTTPLQELLSHAQQEISTFASFNDPNGHYILCQECVSP